MTDGSEIQQLCEMLVEKHGVSLITIAAKLQVGLSTIASSKLSDIQQSIMLITLRRDILMQAEWLNLSQKDVDKALCSIRQNGALLQSLVAANAPISKHAEQHSANILNRLMYPAEPRLAD